MLVQNKKVVNSVRVLLLGAPLFLAACHSDFGPFPMPSGYAHHDELYKAPPGPEPVLKKIKHMHISQPADGQGCEPCASVPQGQAEALISVPADGAFGQAATELVGRLIADFGQPTEPVWLQPAAPTTTEMNFEKALRAALIEKGINIAPAPGLGPFTLAYTITPLGVGDGSRMMVTISLTGTGGVVQEVSGIYALGGGAAMPAPVVMEETALQEAATPVPAPGEPMPIGPLD